MPLHWCAVLALLAGCAGAGAEKRDPANDPSSAAAEEAPAAPAPDLRRASPPVAAAPEPPARIQIYTCPMHSKIRSEKPGPCPICGMALVPVDKSQAGER